MISIQYPIGPFQRLPEPLDAETRRSLVHRIAALPPRVRAAVEGLSDEQLDTPYREGGWTPRQIVHHLADSHVNALVRVKLTLTEERPTLKPYDQERWAEQADVTGVPVSASLAILSGLHERWAHLWRAMGASDFTRTAHHPEMGDITMDYLLQQYAWHGEHHTAQIEGLRARMEW